MYESLKRRKIFSRKYFHPVCTDFTPYRGYKIHSVRDEPYVNIVKSQVLCLPFHSGVGEDDFRDICAEFMRNPRQAANSFRGAVTVPAQEDKTKK